MNEQQPCQQCGAEPGQQHQWREDDCVLRHPLNKPRHPPRANVGHICGGCVDRLREHVREIGTLYSEIANVIPLGSIPDDTAEHRHTKRTGSPAQMRLEAWALHLNAVNTKIRNPDNPRDPEDLLDAYLGSHLPDVPDTTANWAQAVYDAHDWGTAPDTVSGAIAALVADGGIEALAAQPDIDTFDAEITWVRRALRNAHAITDPQPLCDCLEVNCGGHVWRMVGKQSPTCDRCGRRYGKLDLVRARGQQLPERRRLSSHSAGNGGRP